MSVRVAELAVDSRCRLGECILWCERRQRLYWTDIAAAQLWRHDPATGDTRQWSLPQPLACLALASDGRLLLGLAKGLFASDVEACLDSDDLPLQLLANVAIDDAHVRVNDGRSDRHGRFVFGTKSEHADGRRGGRYYQYSAEHGVRELALPPVAIANSICFDGSGTRMYFSDSIEPRIMVCHYDSATAGVSDIQVFVELDDPVAEPDGCIVDAEDALWNAQWGAGRVVRYLADGRVERVIELPARHATCCTLRGPLLYVTSARQGLDAAQLTQQPGSGGVFVHRNERDVSRGEDRVRLP